MTPRKSICYGSEAEELPEPILQQIMSFLDFRDVIRASAVSKAWRSAAATLQFLNVSDDFIRPISDSDSDSEDMESEKVHSMLISAAVLISNANKQNLHTQRFSLQFRGKSSPLELDLIEHLVALTVKENIREFGLDVRSSGAVWNYSLPCSLYTARFLNKVVLGGLKLSLSNLDGIKLPLLRELDLRNNQIDSEFLEQLVSNCPQLVILSIDACFGFHAFRVLGSHIKLERIDLIVDSWRNVGRHLPPLSLQEIERNVGHHLAPQSLQRIEINEAPCLKSFRYRSHKDDSLHVLDVAACKNLKVLELTGFRAYNDKLLESVEQLLSNLSHLESLTLHRWPNRSFRIISNSLRELWLGCNDFVLADVCVNAPHLYKFGFFGRMQSRLSFEALSIKEANFVKTVGDSIIYKKQLLAFLRNSFNHFEKVRLDDFAPRHFKGLQCVRGKPDPPLWDVKCLTIGARYTYRNRYIPVNMEMLEGLLWMAPQLDTLSFDNRQSTLTFQFIHEDSWNVEEAPWIDGNKIWIKVKVESRPADAQGWELKKYYFDAEISMAGFVPLKVVQIMTKVVIESGNCTRSVQGVQSQKIRKR